MHSENNPSDATNTIHGNTTHVIIVSSIATVAETLQSLGSETRQKQVGNSNKS